MTKTEQWSWDDLSNYYVTTMGLSPQFVKDEIDMLMRLAADTDVWPYGEGGIINIIHNHILETNIGSPQNN